MHNKNLFAFLVVFERLSIISHSGIASEWEYILSSRVIINYEINHFYSLFFNYFVPSLNSNIFFFFIGNIQKICINHKKELTT